MLIAQPAYLTAVSWKIYCVHKENVCFQEDHINLQ